MYRLNNIIDGLSGLVGWRQSYNLNKQIDSDLTASSSGLYFQDAHPLLTIENVRAVMPDDWDERYPAYSSSATYTEGDKVSYNSKIWKAGETIIGEPSTDNGWTVFDSVSDFLDEQTEAGIAKTVQTFITEKVNAHETRNILENQTLFDGAGRFNDIVENRGAVVGFEITPLRQTGITMALNRIGLQMRSAIGDVKLYLFHSSKQKPLATMTISFDRTDGDFTWLDFSPADYWASYGDNSNYSGEMPYMQAGIEGGSFYIVYSQSELPEWMDAVNYARDWSREPCQSCNRGNAQVWREMTKYVKIMPFFVMDDTFDTTHNLWDLNDMVYTPNTNYGINFRYTIGCDISDFIITQKSIFANAIQLQVATSLLRRMVNNPDVRVNRNQANAQQLLYDLDGESVGRASGLMHDLNNAYKALSIDTKGMAKVCLTCHSGGVKYGIA